MQISLETIKTIADRLPFDSVCNTMIKWYQTEGWLDTQDLSFSTFTALNDKSIDTAAKVATRIGVTYFITPRITAVASLYNFSIGVYYIGMGFVTAFQENSRSIEEKRKIAQEFHTGFVHVLTAVYDYAIGRLIKIPILGLASVVLFGVMPQLIVEAYKQVFRKPESETPKPAETESGSATPSDVKTSREYVDKNCKIYEFAKKLALGFVPHSFPEMSGGPLAISPSTGIPAASSRTEENLLS